MATTRTDLDARVRRLAAQRGSNPTKLRALVEALADGEPITFGDHSTFVGTDALAVVGPWLHARLLCPSPPNADPAVFAGRGAVIEQLATGWPVAWSRAALADAQRRITRVRSYFARLRATVPT